MHHTHYGYTMHLASLLVFDWCVVLFAVATQWWLQWLYVWCLYVLRVSCDIPTALLHVLWKHDPTTPHKMPQRTQMCYDVRHIVTHAGWVCAQNKCDGIGCSRQMLVIVVRQCLLCCVCLKCFGAQSHKPDGKIKVVAVDDDSAAKLALIRVSYACAMLKAVHVCSADVVQLHALSARSTAAASGCHVVQSSCACLLHIHTSNKDPHEPPYHCDKPKNNYIVALLYGNTAV